MNVGRTVKEGRLADLLVVQGRTRIALKGDDPSVVETLGPFARDVRQSDGGTVLDVASADTFAALDAARGLGMEIISVSPDRVTLEDLFLETIRETSG